jgi:hypothetical protein
LNFFGGCLPPNLIAKGSIDPLESHLNDHLRLLVNAAKRHIKQRLTCSLQTVFLTIRLFIIFPKRRKAAFGSKFFCFFSFLRKEVESGAKPRSFIFSL